MPDHSQDGKHLAYISRRNIGDSRRTPRARGTVLCIYSFENGSIEEISTKLSVNGPPRWSPNGRSILITGSSDDGRWGLYTIEVQTGKVMEIVIDDTITNSYEWSLDGKSIFYVRDSKEGKFCEILAKDLQTGREIKLLRTNEPVGFSISLSPDGRWLAAVDNAGRRQRVLSILPVSGGEPKELYTFEQKTGHYLSHTWSVDGKYVLLANNLLPEEGESGENKTRITLWPWSLFCIPVDGGQPRQVNLGVHLLRRQSVHPDGRHIVFGSFGTIEDFTVRAMGASGVWLMENFLPKTKDEK